MLRTETPPKCPQGAWDGVDWRRASEPPCPSCMLRCSQVATKSLLGREPRNRGACHVSFAWIPKRTEQHRWMARAARKFRRWCQLHGVQLCSQPLVSRPSEQRCTTTAWRGTLNSPMQLKRASPDGPAAQTNQSRRQPDKLQFRNSEANTANPRVLAKNPKTDRRYLNRRPRQEIAVGRAKNATPIPPLVSACRTLWEAVTTKSTSASATSFARTLEFS